MRSNGKPGGRSVIAGAGSIGEGLLARAHEVELLARESLDLLVGVERGDPAPRVHRSAR